MENERPQGVDVVSALKSIPYALLSEEMSGSVKDFTQELRDINKYYKVYQSGQKFLTEGSGGDYLPSTVRYKNAASLINKEARFLFGETPDIIIDPKGDKSKASPESIQSIATLQSIVTSILDDNMFSKNLLKAGKDCFIGKRVGCVLNFNEQTGVSINFIGSRNFIYETDPMDSNKLTKFVGFVVLRDRSILSERRIFKKKYVMMEDGLCYVEEKIYDGAGREIEEVTVLQPTKFKYIPAFVVLNDGLTGDLDGESEIEMLLEFEKAYNRLANADIDSERKSMNPIRYTVDMDPDSTKGLKSSAGSYWDLQHDSNMDKPSPSVGTLSSDMAYSDALSKTLDRLNNAMHDQLDVPNINIETMSGTITSGKALKAIYWPLIVRCAEKMKTWGPQLQFMTKAIIDGALLYPNTVRKYTEDPVSAVAYEVHIDTNYPLPEDEQEEKQTDLAEVTAQTMSKKSYMRKWRELTPSEADEELEQIAKETAMLENAGTMPSDFGPGGTGGDPAAAGASGGADVLDDDQLDDPEDDGLDAEFADLEGELNGD